MLKSSRLILCLGAGVVVSLSPMAWAEAKELSAEEQSPRALDEYLPAEEQVLDVPSTEQELHQQSSENPVSPSSLTMVYITCESWSYRYASCDTGLVVAYVQVDTQYSRTTCTYGSRWGYDAHSVWVNDGCRARFRVYGYPR
jgi:hypothetical protein